MSIVVIAAPAYLGAMKERGEFQDALLFADTDALRAFQAITRQRPAAVVLESGFAATSRGTALIQRIKADPLLSDCDVRVVSIESAPMSAGHPQAGSTPAVASAVAASTPATVVPAAALPAEAEASPLDPDGTRRAERYEIRSGIELLVDGNPATLVDLSVTGAQVMSPTSLKPNQRVRLTLPGAVSIRVNAEITWAVFEMPRTGACYRAGLVFIDPDVAGIAGFIVSNRRPERT